MGLFQFVTHCMGEKYVTPPIISFEGIFEQSAATNPIVFILSPGSDPASDLLKLAERSGFGTNKLKFASAEVMQSALGITPGAVSMLALVNDQARRVTLVLDQSLSEAEAVQCHPLVNTATLVIDRENLFRFLSAIAHEPKVIPVPLVRK